MTPFAGIVHFLENRGDLVGLAVVHDQSFGVDPGQVDFDERILGRNVQWVHAMAARAVGTDDLLFLGFHQVFHRALVLGRPPGLLHAVQENDVDVVDTQLEAIALEVALGVGHIGRVRLGLDHVLIAGNALQGFAKIDVRAVLIGDVEEPNAVIQGVADDPREFLDAEPGLVAGLSAADAAGTHADERNLDAGLAQRDHIGRALG